MPLFFNMASFALWGCDIQGNALPDLPFSTKLVLATETAINKQPPPVCPFKETKESPVANSSFD